MLRLRVTDLDAWVRYIEPERPEFEVSTEEFLAYLRREAPVTEAMKAGSAFHSVMERAAVGNEWDETEEDGYLFRFADGLPDVALPFAQEEEVEKVYDTPAGPVLLRGRIDGRTGIEVTDYKLTSSGFDAERYARSLQWRSYLDMTGAKRFRYLVFQAKNNAPEFWIHSVHELVQWSYEGMHDDVRQRVGELAEFVAQHVPEMLPAQQVRSETCHAQ